MFKKVSNDSKIIKTPLDFVENQIGMKILVYRT